jgi:hypothetical protein
MTVVRALIADICGMPETRVIVKEDGERLMKYHVKVYFDSVNTAAEMQPALRVETILAVLPSEQIRYHARSPCSPFNCTQIKECVLTTCDSSVFSRQDIMFVLNVVSVSHSHPH